MYVAPPQGSYEGRAGEYFQAVCVKGGDVLEDEGCFCAGVATPMLGGGNVCEMKDGAAWCWTAPGTCADGERGRLLAISLSRWAVVLTPWRCVAGTNAGDLGIPGFDYDASLMACAEENSRNEDCDPTAVYPILIPCMTALASPSTFCESDCHLILRPWVDQCMNGAHLSGHGFGTLETWRCPERHRVGCRNGCGRAGDDGARNPDARRLPAPAPGARRRQRW